MAARYESKTFEEAHRNVLDLVSEHPGPVLDIGAGSGRDATWFAAHGHDVVAVEPAARMREVAISRHADPHIRGLDDQLPSLTCVFRTRLAFNLIWLSAVWMHVPLHSLHRAFRKLVTLLQPGDRIVMSLREGPPPGNGEIYPTHVEEIKKLAHTNGIAVPRVTRGGDRLGREDVFWWTVCLQAPDDGIGVFTTSTLRRGVVAE